MSRLAELIDRLCPYWCYNNLYDFGLESADKVADFHNNGGLEFHNEGVNYALQYASVSGGRVEIGAWVWLDVEDFDQDAIFTVYDEDDFSGGELKSIYNKIEEIYGRQN